MSNLPEQNQVFHKWLFYFLIGLSLVLVLVVATLLAEALRVKQAHEQELEALLVQMADTIKQTEDKQEYLDHLMKDPEFRERIIREKLGRARTDEMIYNFQSPNPPPAQPAKKTNKN